MKKDSNLQQIVWLLLVLSSSCCIRRGGVSGFMDVMPPQDGFFPRHYHHGQQGRPRRSDDSLKTLITTTRTRTLFTTTTTSLFSISKPTTKDLETALCIVPPTQFWDTLQRARHQAQDPSFHEWPPCIRLFHPFTTNSGSSSGSSGSKAKTHIAFEVAQVLEELEVEPFDITLDEWAIIPNVEAIQAEYRASQMLPTLAVEDSYKNNNNREEIAKFENSVSSLEDNISSSSSTSSSYSWTSAMSKDDQLTQQLIQREEILGREKKAARAVAAARRKQVKEDEAAAEAAASDGNLSQNDPSSTDKNKKNGINNKKRKKKSKSSSSSLDMDNDDNDADNDDNEDDESSSTTATLKEILEAQQRRYEEFNGPCILCLEPNATSKQLLCDLRASLQEMLPHSSYFSPSSIYGGIGAEFYSNNNNNNNSTTTSSKQQQHAETENDASNDIFAPQPYRPLIPISSFGSVSAAMDIARRLKGLWDPLTIPVTELHIVSRQEDDDYYDKGQVVTPTTMATVTTAIESESSTIPWGCNAKIKLLVTDEEDEKEENEVDQEMLQRLLDEGEPGGMDLSLDYFILEEEEEEPANSLLEWLNDDEDWDEGTTVVIGRTTFLTGDQRTYVGMPATSTVDAKDRFFGGGSGGGADGSVAGGSDAVLNGWGVSGAARRRTTVGRGSNVWKEGEYGRRASDYNPFTKRDRARQRTLKAERLEKQKSKERLALHMDDEDDDDADDDDVEDATL